MSLLAQTSGTLVNVVAVLAGGALGLWARGRLPTRTTTTMMQAIGLATLFVGLSGAADLGRVDGPPGVVAALLGLAVGAAVGEGLRLHDRLDRLGERLRRRVRGEGRFTEGFVAATLLFLVGPLALIGAIQNGLVGDPSFLIVKSTLDGVSSVVLAASFGWGVLASAGAVLVYQGAVSLGAGVLAQWLPDPATSPVVLLVNGTGGLMIVGLGLGLLDVVTIRIANLLPGLLLAPLAWWALRVAF